MHIGNGITLSKVNCKSLNRQVANNVNIRFSTTVWFFQILDLFLLFWEAKISGLFSKILKKNARGKG